MEETGWSRASRLWALFEWSFIGLGLIFTLIWLAVNDCLRFLIGSRPPPRDTELRCKRVLIANGDSEMGRAIAHRLRNNHNCNVISLGPTCRMGGGSGGAEAQRKDIICDLTSSEEVRTQVQRIWEQLNGIDLVVNCEVQDRQRRRVRDVGQTVAEIGSSIQRMINLLMNLVPKMSEQGNGRFVIVRNCHQPRRHQDEFELATRSSEYNELLEQFLSAAESTSSTAREPPKISLVQIYCGELPKEGSGGDVQAMEDVVGRILAVVDSGKSGVVDVTKSDLWTLLIRALKVGRAAGASRENVELSNETCHKPVDG